MPTRLQKAYLKNMRDRYQKSTKKEKTFILNEFCLYSGYERKHGSRILANRVEPRVQKPGPKPKYDDGFTLILRDLWEVMGRLCGKNMAAAIPLWLSKSNNGYSTNVRKLLESVSAATMDRLLQPFKGSKPKGLSTTTASRMKNRIPMRTLDAKANCPGIVNADTVAHCGFSIAGDYMNSLTIVDLYSGWTANRAIWKKDGAGTLAQIKKAELSLPFTLIEFFSDNGNEFINEKLEAYFGKRTVPINFKRSRAYKKNDNCYVEQKNFTHVRKLFSYIRIDCRELVTLANEIYQIYWNPLQNFFIPSRKLIEKQRINSKIVKKYDAPKTPYQRLIESGYLTTIQTKTLKQEFNRLDPFFLRRELNKKLKIFFEKLDEYNKFNCQKVG